jgi:hypothetical protein
MIIDAAGLAVPGLEVIAKTADSITLRRIAPEINLSRHGYYGGAYQVHRWKFE